VFDEVGLFVGEVGSGLRYEVQRRVDGLLIQRKCVLNLSEQKWAYEHCFTEYSLKLWATKGMYIDHFGGRGWAFGEFGRIHLSRGINHPNRLTTTRQCASLIDNAGVASRLIGKGETFVLCLGLIAMS